MIATGNRNFKSQSLIEILNTSLAAQDDVIFAVDFHRSVCDNVEALLKNTVVRRMRKNNSTLTKTSLGILKVVLFDFRDNSQSDSWECLER